MQICKDDKCSRPVFERGFKGGVGDFVREHFLLIGEKSCNTCFFDKNEVNQSYGEWAILDTTQSCWTSYYIQLFNTSVNPSMHTCVSCGHGPWCAHLWHEEDTAPCPCTLEVQLQREVRGKWQTFEVFFSKNDWLQLFFRNHLPYL